VRKRFPGSVLTAPHPGDTVPFAPFEWLLALRYLRARRKEGFISVITVFSFLGILLGVATLIVVMAVMNGFHKEMFGKILGIDGHVVAYKEGTADDFEDYLDVAKKLEAIPTVRHVVPRIEGQVIASTPAQGLGAKVRGISEDGIRALPLIADKVQAGTLEGFDDRAGIALGAGFMRYLRVNVGDTVTLVSPRGARTPFGVVPRVKAYRVTAIVEMGVSELDRSMIFMPLAEAQRFFGKGDSVDMLDIVVDDAERVDGSVAAMKAGTTGLRFVDWRERNASLFSVLQVERNMMFIILSIIVLVAAFNIVSGLIMLVKDKGSEIGILRTIGATQGAILRVFLIIGASIGVVGTLAGCVLGVLFCLRIDDVGQLITWLSDSNLDPNIEYLTRLPADLNWQTTAFIVVMALVLSVLATLYPSWRASRLDPVEALRYE
jgi:lipoprotein-releasing system permease protein